MAPRRAMPAKRVLIDKIRRQFNIRSLSPGDDGFDSYIQDAAEIGSTPEIVLFPTSTFEVAEIVRFSHTERIPITARGAGTGYSGGAVALSGGIVLSVEEMNQIISIDSSNHTALVESGVITNDLDLAANEHGLFYPPDPASHKESTLGGNIAECAGGLRCVKYGVTRDYVLGCEYVDFAGGIHTTGALSDSDPINITPLLVGSEGTLGIVTRIFLKLLPMSSARKSFLFTFESNVEAAQFVASVRRSGIVPCAFEYMDRGALECTAEYLQLTEFAEADALLLIEFDGIPDEVERDSKIMEEIGSRFDPLIQRSTVSDDERDKLWQMRREISTAVKSFSKIKTSEDICVPLSLFSDIVTEIQKIAKQLELKTAAFGHAGDGNLHVCFIIPELDDDILARMEGAKKLLLTATLEMRGTITGEHGIGFTKKDFLVREVGEDGIDLFARVKKSFDPDSLINPGKIF